MKTLLAFCLLFGDPTLTGRSTFTPYKDYAAAVEINHFFDAKGRLVYDQVVFWDNNAATGRFVVKAWMLCQEGQDRYPMKESDGLFHVRWADNGVHRDVRSPLFKESWSQTDPEREDKKRWPESLRSGLNGPLPKTEGTE